MRRWIILLLLSLGPGWLVLPSLAAACLAGDPLSGGIHLWRAGHPASEHWIRDAAISEVQVFLRSRGDTETYSGTAVIQDGQIIYHHDLTAEPLRAFSHDGILVPHHPKTGEPYLSDTYSFYYEDNRFDWQEHFFRIHLLSTGMRVISTSPKMY